MLLCAAIVLLTVLPKLLEVPDLSRQERSQIGNSEVERSNLSQCSLLILVEVFLFLLRPPHPAIHLRDVESILCRSLTNLKASGIQCFSKP